MSKDLRLPESAKDHRPSGREATELALVEAALELLARDGVLSGLRLQEVADEAGVNRGLIHHYFGDRRVLLRRALGLRRAMGAPTMQAQLARGLIEKAKWAVRAFIGDRGYAKVVLLLAIDGDEEVQPIPHLEDRLTDLQRERTEGVLADDVDLVALIAATDSLLHGYAALRDALARQLGTSATQLDRRVEATIVRLTSAVLTDPPPRSASARRRRRVRSPALGSGGSS